MISVLDIQIAWTIMCAVLLVTSVINGWVTLYRGAQARKRLHEEGREADWQDGPQKIFWQRVALVFFFTFKGLALTVVGVLYITTPISSSCDTEVTPVRWVFGVSIFLLALFATAYQVGVLIMRPGLDQDIIRAEARDTLRNRVESKPPSAENEVFSAGLKKGPDTSDDTGGR